MSKLSWLAEKIMKHKKLLIFGVVISVAAVGGIIVVKNMNEKKAQMQAFMNQPQTSTVERRTLVSSVSATGTLTSVDSKDVTVNLNGMEIKSISVEVGDVVETGQILCELDSQDIEEDLADARVALNVANEKNRMENESAERNLQDALDDFNKDVDRGNQDLADIYHEYLESLVDVEEAKKDWDDAIGETKKNKAEYESYKKKLSEAESKKNAAGESEEISKAFNTKKSELMQYVEKKGISLYSNVSSTISLGNNFSKVTAETLISSYESKTPATSITTTNSQPAETPENKDETFSDEGGTPEGGSEGNGEGENGEGENGEGENGSGGSGNNQNGTTNGASETQYSKPTETEPTNTTNQESTDSEPAELSNPKPTDNSNPDSEEGDLVAKIIDSGNKNSAGELSLNFAGIGSAQKKEIKEKVDDYLSDLKSINDQYETALQLEKEYQELDQEVSKWEAEFNSSEQEESNAKKTYEQAVSTSESQLESYEKQLRTMDDTKKSGENSILSKSESLYSTQLNSLTNGDSEEEKIKEYQEQLEDCIVKAPISGVISAVNVEKGDLYNGSAIVTIDDTSAFEVTTEIDEYEIGKIKKGQQVIIKTNATGDTELEGKVIRINPRASSGGSEVTYTVTISVDTTNEMLRMDMTAKLSIILESKENVLTVPYEAVQEDNGRYYVEAVVEANNSASKEDKISSKPEGIKEGEMPQMPEGMDFENMPQMPEGMDFENMPQMTERTGEGGMPQRPEGMSGGQIPQGRSGRSSGGSTKLSAGNAVTSELATRRIYVDKGIESDYYIEIISNEITEGMKIVVPSSDRQGGGMNIQNMMMRQGPMGGF